MGNTLLTLFAGFVLGYLTFIVTYITVGFW
jgi:hypothetical protein